MKKQYNIPKQRNRNSSGRVTFENPIMKLIATIAVLGIGVLLAGMSSFRIILNLTSSY